MTFVRREASAFPLTFTSLFSCASITLDFEGRAPAAYTLLNNLLLYSRRDEAQIPAPMAVTSLRNSLLDFLIVSTVIWLGYILNPGMFYYGENVFYSFRENYNFVCASSKEAHISDNVLSVEDNFSANSFIN